MYKLANVDAVLLAAGTSGKSLLVLADHWFVTEDQQVRTLDPRAQLPYAAQPCSSVAADAPLPPVLLPPAAAVAVHVMLYSSTLAQCCRLTELAPFCRLCS